MNNLFNKKVTGKILSVVLATMLWLYVITEQNPVIYKELSVPVEFVNVETLSKNDLILLNDESFSISFRLRGNKNILDRVNKNTITATADLKKINGKGLIEIPVEVSGIPIGIDILWTSSNTVKLNVDNIISQTMPIEVKTTGNPLQGMAAMEPIANPREVLVKGAESIVKIIKSAIVEIDIGSSEGEVKQTLPVMLIDSKGDVVNDVIVSPKQVDVIIPVENTKRVIVEADYDIKADQGYVVTNIDISPKEIYIAGNKEYLDGITKVMTEKVELKGAKSFIEKEVALLLPEGVELANKYEKVIFSANIEKIIEIPIETDKIDIRNVSENIEVDVQAINITAIVKGPESLVNTWDVKNAFYIDLKDIDEGVYNIQVLYDKPEQIELTELYPSQITIILRKKE